MGLFSKKNSVTSEIAFLGVSGQAATLKCLLLAGIKGVSLRMTFAPANTQIDQVHSYQYLTPFEKAPLLTQGDFSVAGTRGILTFIDIRGTGASLAPRKARLLGQQNYWIDVSNGLLAPAIQEIVNGDPGDETRVCCNKILSRLNNILSENQFIVGSLSFADPNVAAYIYVLKNHAADLEPYPDIDNWLMRLESQMLDSLKSEYLPLLHSKPE